MSYQCKNSLEEERDCEGTRQLEDWGFGAKNQYSLSIIDEISLRHRGQLLRVRRCSRIQGAQKTCLQQEERDQSVACSNLLHFEKHTRRK